MLVVNDPPKKLPAVRVQERSNGKWLFQIITTDTAVIMEEAEAKRLYTELHKAFRPTKRAADLAKRSALQKSLVQAEKLLRKAGYTVTPPNR